MNKLFGNKQPILVFLFLFPVALAQNTTGITTATTMAAAGGNGPLATPHEALRSAPMHRMDGGQPPKLADVFLGGVEGVNGPQSAPLFRR
jgi:hypothetical protein